MKVGRGAAWGKVVLCGEHAVVYGHPAVAMAVSLRTTVTATPRPGPLALPVDDPRLYDALFGLYGDGWTIDIDSDIPMGRGMGSSAALSVAAVRAWADAHGSELSDAVVHARAFDLERVFHGTPSGIDHAMAARGGVARFVRGETGPELTPLPLPRGTFVVIDSGSAGDTKALVAGVRARRPEVDPMLDAIGALVDRAVAVLDDAYALGPLLTDNHGLLQRIGVSTPELDRIVDLALEGGALGAKLAGAGGGGVVIALTVDPTPVVEAARASGYDAFPVHIPEAGHAR